LPRQNRKANLAPPLRPTCQNVQLQFEARAGRLTIFFQKSQISFAMTCRAKGYRDCVIAQPATSDSTELAEVNWQLATRH
jgi:hypothetical protein